VQRTPPDARVEMERQRDLQKRIVEEIGQAGRQNRRALQGGVATYATGCTAFTRNLRRVVWPQKFRPDLPKGYDGTNNPIEFLQLYTTSIQAAGGDDKVMANWFSHALRDSALSWLLNLPEDSIDSWEDLCKQFVANFKGTYERALTYNDLRAVRQKSGETLRKYIQRFSQVRNKIPNIPDSHVIAAFREGVTNRRMLEKLGIHDTLSSVVKLFDIADKCAKAEEGLLFTKVASADDPPEGSKAHKKRDETKRKPTAVLAAEPGAKHAREDSAEDGEKKIDNRPFCIYHNRRGHATENCYDLKQLSKKREQEEGSGGRGRGRNYRKGGRKGGYQKPQGTQANAAEKNNNLPDEEPGGYQAPRGAMACILGGAQAPKSNNQFKQFARELNAALPGVETSRPLKWSQYTIAFDAKDHPKSTKTVGTLPLVCTPTINNIAVGKTLIDGGAGLNVISVETFETLQVPYEWLMPSRPFTGVTSGSISPLGQVRLAVTFGTQQNYRTELIDFDVAHIGLPYNAILGYPALAKFMAVTHHAYNMVKIPGSGGTITIHGHVQDATRAVELAYKAAAMAFPADEDLEPLARPKKKKQLFSQEQAATKKVSLSTSDSGAEGSGASVTIGAGLPPK
jgi:hypothetical protein